MATSDFEQSLRDTSCQLIQELNETLEAIEKQHFSLNDANRHVVMGLAAMGIGAALPLWAGGLGALSLFGVTMALSAGTVEAVVGALMSVRGDAPNSELDRAIQIIGAPYSATVGLLTGDMDRGIYLGKVIDVAFQIRDLQQAVEMREIVSNTLGLALTAKEIGQSPDFPIPDKPPSFTFALSKISDGHNTNQLRSAHQEPPHDLNSLERSVFAAPNHPIFGTPQSMPSASPNPGPGSGPLPPIPPPLPKQPTAPLPGGPPPQARLPAESPPVASPAPVSSLPDYLGGFERSPPELPDSDDKTEDDNDSTLVWLQ